MNKKELLWYKDDQFKNQFSNEFQKKLIASRWNIFKKLIKKHINKKQISILDAGCGDGINILGLKIILKELNLNYTIKAIDINVIRLERVKKIFPCVDLEQIDITHETITTEKFDLIVFNHVLEHIKNDEKALKNLSKALDVEGLLILGIPNEGCLLATLRNHLFQRKILKYTDHVHFYTLASIKQNY